MSITHKIMIVIGLAFVIYAHLLTPTISCTCESNFKFSNERIIQTLSKSEAKEYKMAMAYLTPYYIKEYAKNNSLPNESIANITNETSMRIMCSKIDGLTGKEIIEKYNQILLKMPDKKT